MEDPLHKLRVLADGILETPHADFETLYAKIGRLSSPPERLLRASDSGAVFDSFQAETCPVY